MELEAGSLDAPAAVVRVVRGGAHHVDAARDHDLAEARPDLHRRVEHGLEAGAAAAVDLGTGDGLGQSGVERGDPADGGGLGGRVGVPEDHLVDGGGVDSGTGHELRDDACGECGRRLLCEHSAEPADGGAQWFADDDIELLIGHVVAFRDSGVHRWAVSV